VEYLQRGTISLGIDSPPEKKTFQGGAARGGKARETRAGQREGGGHQGPLCLPIVRNPSSKLRPQHRGGEDKGIALMADACEVGTKGKNVNLRRRRVVNKGYRYPTELRKFPRGARKDTSTGEEEGRVVRGVNVCQFGKVCKDGRSNKGNAIVQRPRPQQRGKEKKKKIPETPKKVRKRTRNVPREVNEHS